MGSDYRAQKERRKSLLVGFPGAMTLSKAVRGGALVLAVLAGLAPASVASEEASSKNHTSAERRIRAHGSGKLKKPRFKAPPVGKADTARVGGDKIASLDKASKKELEAYSRAIIRNDRDEAAYLNRGVFFIKHEEFRLASEDFNRVVRLNPRSPQGHAMLGAAYHLIALEARKKDGSMANIIKAFTDPMGSDLDAAVSELREALRLDPQLTEVHGILDNIYEVKTVIARGNTGLRRLVVIVLVCTLLALGMWRVMLWHQAAFIRDKAAELRESPKESGRSMAPFVKVFEETYLDFRTWRGSPLTFSREDMLELIAVVESPAIWHDGSSFPGPTAWWLANELAVRGHYKKAVPSLEAPALLHAADLSGGGGCVKAVKIFAKAGLRDTLVARLCASHWEPVVRSAFASAFLTEGDFPASLEILLSQALGNFTPGDPLMIFVAHILAENFDAAEAEVDRALSARPVAGSSELYYLVGRWAQQWGKNRLALKLYQAFIDAGIPYSDTRARHAKLEEQFVAGSPRPIPAAVVRPDAAISGSEAAAPVVPSNIISGRYELGKVLGRGAMGVVYEGHDRILDCKVAIKMMLPEFRAIVDRERFRTEAKIVASLNHPNIVHINEVVEVESELYLIFQYLDGQTLADKMDDSLNKGLPLVQCIRILSHVCRAVEYMHTMKVLHRDLKPSNIMLPRRSLPMVMDFGLSRKGKDKASQLIPTDTSGTPEYMAPEQHEGDNHSSSDVFSIGVMLYEMLTGKPPFQEPKLLWQKQGKLYVRASKVVTYLPKGLDELLDRALDPDHLKRTRSPMKLMTELEEFR